MQDRLGKYVKEMLITVLLIAVVHNNYCESMLLCTTKQIIQKTLCLIIRDYVFFFKKKGINIWINKSKKSMYTSL